MTSSDAQVLAGVIVAIGVVFFLPRPMIVGPLVYAWIGGGIGLCLAFLNCFDVERDRLFLDDSVPRLFLGMFCGGTMGIGVMQVYLRSPRLRKRVEIVSLTLLFGTVGAVFGSWKSARTRGEALEPILERAAICMAAVFVMGLLQSKLQRKRLRPPAEAVYDRRISDENGVG